MDRVRSMIGWDYAYVKSCMKNSEGDVYVAVLDSGVCAHPDLQGRIEAFCDFTSNKSYDARKPYDDNGHGTHVCGIIGGSGIMSNGRYMGIAPNVKFICAKVLDRNGKGGIKNLVSALIWIRKLQDTYPIKVLNISIEIESEDDIDPDEWDAFSAQMEALWEDDTLIIAAAGNKGPSEMSLSPIGDCGVCICVGCNDLDYKGGGRKRCVDYSGRGPGKHYIKKPDIVAPGTDIVSCGHEYAKKPYVSKSGTSMAAPIVSGACALYLHKYPNTTACELRRKLLLSAVDLGLGWNMQGNGMVNIERLLMQNIWQNT